MSPQLDERRAKNGEELRDGIQSADTLPLLYEVLFTGIVRLQAGRERVADVEAFRRRTKAALDAVERDAIAAGYDGRDVRDTHFAVVAFLDSVVLNTGDRTDRARAEWERRTLQEELFGQTDAGVVFFDKLEHYRSRRDSPQLADILEVFLLCLLLGFEGRHAGMRGELSSITERVRQRIEDIRGSNRPLSPSGLLPSEQANEPPQVVVQQSRRFQLIMLAVAVLTLLCFMVFKLHLIWAADQLRTRLF